MEDTDLYTRLCENSRQIQSFGLTFLELLVASLILIVHPSRPSLQMPFHVAIIQSHLFRVLFSLLQNRVNMSSDQFSELLSSLNQLDSLASIISALYY